MCVLIIIRSFIQNFPYSRKKRIERDLSFPLPPPPFLFLLWRCDPMRARASSFLRFLDHTQWRTTVGRTPLDEWSACRRDLYLTTHNTHNRQISMPPVGFEPTISAGERPQTYTLDHAATGTSKCILYRIHYSYQILMKREFSRQIFWKILQ